MKRSALVFMMLLIAFGAQAVAAQGNGHKPFNETVYVDGTADGWQSTGIDVKGGITISATGTFNCDTDDSDGIWSDCEVLYGPGGKTGSLPQQDWKFVAVGLPMYSLIGKFGVDGEPFFVGSGPTTVLGDGMLYLAINDNIFSDNDGGFTVFVTSCRPGNGNGDQNHCHFGAPGQN